MVSVMCFLPLVDGCLEGQLPVVLPRGAAGTMTTRSGSLVNDRRTVWNRPAESGVNGWRTGQLTATGGGRSTGGGSLMGGSAPAAVNRICAISAAKSSVEVKERYTDAKRR